MAAFNHSEDARISYEKGLRNLVVFLFAHYIEARSPGHLGAGMSNGGRRVGIRRPICGSQGSKRPIGKICFPHCRKITGHLTFPG